MTCHDCCNKHLMVIKYHLSEMAKAVSDYKVKRNEVNIFDMDEHLTKVFVHLGRIDDAMPNRILTEDKECV